MIQQWIDNGYDYQEGVKLYEKYNIDAVFLERFKLRENTFLHKKMKDDLIAFMEQLSSTPQMEFEEDKRDSKSHPMEFYPSELHEVYMDRINTHLQARALKIELNKLSYGQAGQALPIIIKIDKLFEQNEKCWRILNHYEDTQQILPYKSSSNYSVLSPSAQVRTLQNRESAASKLKKNIQRWENELNAYDPIKKAKKEQDLLVKKEKLQILLNDITELKELIYNDNE